MNETRYVYSAACSWHGPIQEVGKTEPMPAQKIEVSPGRFFEIPSHGLPCCPHCGSMLFEMPSREKWDNGAKEHEAKGHTNYVAFLEWTRTQKRCWKTLRIAAGAFEEATGKKVKWDL